MARPRHGILAPQLHVDGDRGATDPCHGRDRFGEVAGTDRRLEIGSVDRGGYHRLAAGAHRGDARDDVHHRQRLAAEEGAVVVGVGWEDDLGASLDDLFGSHATSIRGDGPGGASAIPAGVRACGPKMQG